MFAISDNEEGQLIAVETPHYSKVSDQIDVALSQGGVIILVMDIQDVEALGIDPASIQIDGEEQSAPPA